MPNGFMAIVFHRRLTRVTLPALAVALAGLARAQLVSYEGFEDYAGGIQVESDPNGSAGTPLDGGTGWGGAYDVSNAIKTLVRIENRSTTAIASSAFHDSLPIVAATTYLLVARIQPTGGAYDTVNLFVNPSSLDDPGPPSATITAPSGLTTLSHVFIRTAFLDSNDAYVLDEWRVGRDYGSVVGSLRNALAILPPSVPGASPTLRWSASLPAVVLESSATLAAGSWELVTGPFTLVAGDWTCPVAIAPETPRRYYRLRR